MYSALAAIVAVGIFVVTWYLGGEVARFLDRLRRGLGNSWVQLIFRELLVPGVAGYFGNHLAARWFTKSRVWHVFYVFVVALGAFIVRVEEGAPRHPLNAGYRDARVP